MSLLSMLITETGFTGLGYVTLFSPFIISLVMQLAYHRFSSGTLLAMLVAYSALMGMSLSFIFVIYTSGSIFVTFLVTAATFGSMALLGYTTKTDLTKFGGIMYMLFIGFFFATIVNAFMGSEMFDYIISFIGIFIFTGLTAYWVQMLKRRGMDPQMTGMDRDKMAIIGGLQLYILFINLFLVLLRFMGNRN
jgi:FtsH-binding integral membrane protein